MVILVEFISCMVFGIVAPLKFWLGIGITFSSIFCNFVNMFLRICLFIESSSEKSFLKQNRMRLSGSCHILQVFCRNSSFTNFRWLGFMSHILTCLENTKLRARLERNIYKIVTHQIMRASQNVRQITFIIFDEGRSKCHTNDESKTHNSCYEKSVFPWMSARWVSRIWSNAKWTEEKFVWNYQSFCFERSLLLVEL